MKDKLHKSAFVFIRWAAAACMYRTCFGSESEIILLDEPTSALDPVSTGKIESMLLELRERYTMIIVTHNMSQASRISDKTAFFLDGHLIEYNDTKKIFMNPEKQETEDYISGRFG